MYNHVPGRPMRCFTRLSIPAKNLRLGTYHELVHFEQLVITGLDNEIGELGGMEVAGFLRKFN